MRSLHREKQTVSLSTVLSEQDFLNEESGAFYFPVQTVLKSVLWVRTNESISAAVQGVVKSQTLLKRLHKNAEGIVLWPPNTFRDSGRLNNVLLPQEDHILIPRPMDMTWQKGLCRHDYAKELEMGRWSALPGWAPNNHRGSYKREAGGEGLEKEMEWWKQSSETQRDVWRCSSADFEDRRGTSKEMNTASGLSTRLSPRGSRRNQTCQHFDFSPMRQTLDLSPPEP